MNAKQKQKDTKHFSIQNAKIGFRNFSGREGKYNTPGNRNFAIFLDNDIAERLIQDGWNVRHLDPKDPDEERQPIIQVKIAFGYRPPKVVMISGGKQTILTEETIDILDWADIENVDLAVRPYHWSVQGKEGIKAYLKVMYVTLVEDEFASKYREVPDSAMECVLSDDGKTCL